MSVTLPNDLDQYLKKRALGSLTPKKLSEHIVALSNHYQKNRDTPWLESGSLWAQLGYFFPLNYLRLRTVFEEAVSLGFLTPDDFYIDVGSGLGPTSLLFHGSGVCIEQSKEARNEFKKIRQDLGLKSIPTLESFSNLDAVQKTKAIGVFSYSFNEIPDVEWLTQFSSLMILEPSTHLSSQRLLKFREDLKNQGWYLWAPCTHQETCPLFETRDWCHSRLPITLPDWMKEVESFLPMKNRTLTYSYLLAKREAPPFPAERIRVIGDTLEEKGKTRQLICRKNKREFFSWLRKDGKPEFLQRGEVVELLTAPDERGNELRLTAHSLSKWKPYS